ncbi:MAG: NfeD family protein [Candidatus Hodarchaeales archaeon]|jgi:membrane protein implicated in regulation of membrane protease activity
MVVDPQQITISGIGIGIFLLFIGSLLNIPLLYDIGFILFLGAIVITFLQWFTSGGAIEMINWLPFILIFSIIMGLGSDFVSQSEETQFLTLPLIIIVLIIILGFLGTQGGDLSFIIPFLPAVIGVSLLGIVVGELLWQDTVRGLTYGIGILGVFIILIWMKVRQSQGKPPVVGDRTSIIGTRGIVVSEISPTQEGRVKIGGAIWKAQSDMRLEEEEEIEVIGISESKLILKVTQTK